MDNIMNLTEELREINISLCFICQKRKRNGCKDIALQKATTEGILQVKNAAEKRTELGETSDICKRIDKYLQNDSEINISLMKWHKSCYGNFTQKSKIDRLIKEKTEEVINKESDIAAPYGGTTRSRVSALEWNLCIFCQKNSDMNLSNVEEMPTSNYIIKNAKLNLRLFIALSNVSDCVAAEAKYHLNCYAIFKKLIQRTDKRTNKY